jgi:hypothetical protein
LFFFAEVAAELPLAPASLEAAVSSPFFFLLFFDPLELSSVAGCVLSELFFFLDFLVVVSEVVL